MKSLSKNNELVLGIFDKKIYYWYENTNINNISYLIKLWIDPENELELVHVCNINHTSLNKNYYNLFNIVVDMYKQKIFKNNVELNYK